LGQLGEQLDHCWQDYRESYRRWHEATFGVTAVTVLREAFDAPTFRAVKMLSRLPLPLPEPAHACLDALTRARACYCPGFFAGFDGEGCCTRCRLPLGTPSPMPDPANVRLLAEEALVAYAELLAHDSWAAGIQARLPRAPEAIAAHAATFLVWQPADGPDVLLEILDDHLLAWLCREDQPAAQRHIEKLNTRLQGRDLTLAEARETILDWLDPEQALGEATVLRFE
jgi:hypothetical protein